MQTTDEEIKEFTKLVRERIGPIDFKQRTKECLGEFAESDDSGKLKLDRKQMMLILTQRGSQPLDVEQAQEFIDMFDKNNDGVLDVEELAEAMYPTEHGEPEQQSFTEGQAAE
ncbi:hypothetical protein MAR_023749 [Mya arenaria]|uniref:EF-hand domain-containing protein n=1 Tax=Mya arenaria TaxID=6604 RepID=A0ABY7DNV2_MYAAR|nr:hypothetical protein MAR_023749 [Mya arenaria]